MTKSQRFVAWICNSALLQDELLGDRIHKQLLTRAAPLFITMARNSIFTIQDLTFLFQRGQGKYLKAKESDANLFHCLCHVSPLSKTPKHVIFFNNINILSSFTTL